MDNVPAESPAAWLKAEERICPVLAAPAFIHGRHLRIRVGGQEHEILAPPRYLKHLYDWCTGDRSLHEIRRLAEASHLGAPYGRFLDALLNAGLLIDAAQALPHAARELQRPPGMGHSAPKDVWPQVRNSLPSQLPDEAVALPAPSRSGLRTLLARRRSANGFSAAPVSVQALSDLLASMYGAIGIEGQTQRRRAVASAGGFYQLQLWLVLLKPVGEFGAGTYGIHYRADGSAGLMLLSAEWRPVVRAFVHPHRLAGATGVVIVASELRLGSLKYRNRIYPYALLEAGAVLQNGALASVEAGLGWRILGGFDGDRLQALCRLGNTTPLACAVFGMEPTPTSPPERSPPLQFAWVESPSGSSLIFASALMTTDTQAASPCWGRDVDPIRAYNKALAEATERAAFCSPRETLQARARDLAGEWLHPDQVVRYSSAQYRRAGFPFVRFAPDEPRQWLPARRTTDGAPVWVLAELCLGDAAFDPDYRARLVTRATSSGCASHATEAEALSEAVFELIERDAFARHWLEQRGGSEITLDSLPGSLQAEAAALAENGCQVEVQMLAPLGIPVWMVIARSARDGFCCVGAGAGADPFIALNSAWTEAQTGAWARLSGASAPPLRVGEVRTARDHADLHAQRRHFHRTDCLTARQRTHSFDAWQRSWPRSMDAAVAILAAHGCGPVHVVDLSLEKPPRLWEGASIRTVRALIPGLIPLWFGHGLIPAGMLKGIASGGRFPHPFP
jgi:ribosomal protein S12 methylthiotransferase accessory factor